MQTLAVVWLTGGMICTLAYLIGIWPGFRAYTRTSGVVLEVFHFGTRALMVFALWPILTVAFVGIMVESISRSTGRNKTKATKPG